MDSAPSQEEDKDFAQRFRDHFETLVPEIQRRWPEVTHQALEATRGSFDEVVHLLPPMVIERCKPCSNSWKI